MNPSSLLKKPKREKGENHIVINDISGGKEYHPIPVIDNDGSADLEKIKFVYSTTSTMSTGTRQLITGDDSGVHGCECYGQCGADCECENSSIITFDPEYRIVDNPMSYNLYNDFYVQCGIHCGCRGRCQRKILPDDKVLKKLEMHFMKGKGFGVVAAQPIAAGMPIAEYVGEIFVHATEFNLYPKSDYQQDLLVDNKHNKLIIDARRIGNVARFINHSCFNNILPICVYPSIPNLQRSSPLPRVALIAFRDILPGQELSFDYRAGYFETRHIPCLCYEPNCLAPPENYTVKARSVEKVKKEIAENKRKMHILFYEAGDIEAQNTN